MKTIAEKLDHFANDIMADVALKREIILDGVEQEIQETYDKKETEYYTRSYEIIQDGLKQIDKDRNAITSKAYMTSKMQLLSKRNEIIDDVLGSVRDELRSFTKSNDYPTYLMKMIEEVVANIGEGDITIIINITDSKYAKIIEEQFRCEVIVENINQDIIGGCKVLNKSKNIFIDDSFEKKLLSLEEPFLQMCKMKIE